MVEKYFCDICGKETDGILEHFDHEIEFFQKFPKYDDEGIEVSEGTSLTIQDMCFDCHKILYNFLQKIKRRHRRMNPSCPECYSPSHKKGFLPTRSGRKQRYLCNHCGRNFTENNGVFRF